MLVTAAHEAQLAGGAVPEQDGAGVGALEGDFEGADGGFLEVSAVHHGEGRGVCGQQLVLVSVDWSLCRASFR